MYKDELTELVRRAKEKLFPRDGRRPRMLTDREKAAWNRYLAEQSAQEDGEAASLVGAADAMYEGAGAEAYFETA